MVLFRTCSLRGGLHCMGIWEVLGCEFSEAFLANFGRATSLEEPKGWRCRHIYEKWHIAIGYDTQMHPTYSGTLPKNHCRLFTKSKSFVLDAIT
jgi:hypothetical protein